MVKLLRSRATEWKIAPGRVAVLGFSAGGHLTASAGTVYNDVDANAGLRYDDPLAFCSVLQTENELRLTAPDLFASDSEKKSPALLAAGF